MGTCMYDFAVSFRLVHRLTGVAAVSVRGCSMKYFIAETCKYCNKKEHESFKYSAYLRIGYCDKGQEQKLTKKISFL